MRVRAREGRCVVVVGCQWGDEGKGKIVDVFTPRYDIIARFQGGPNAGHTLEFNGIKHVLRTIPSGIFRENSINIICNGVVIDPVVVMGEIDALKGLVERTGVEGDRRAFRVRLTDRGRRAFTQMAEQHEHWIVEAFEGLSPRDLEQLYKLLGKVKQHQLDLNQRLTDASE